MAAAAGPRSLSDLPDGVLRRILFFAPAREAATTAVLSRRWRWLWRTSGAVNLDTRSFNQQGEPEIQPQRQSYSLLDGRLGTYGSRFSTKEREGFLRAAGEALAAAAVPVTRLSVIIAADSRIHPTRLEDWSEHDLIGAVVSNPAAGRVEELHVEVDDLNKSFTLGLGTLPSSETLRVARIISCKPLTAATPNAAFPRLSELHLQECTVPLVDLQRIVDAAPLLETLHLESCYLVKEKKEDFHHGPAPKVQCCRECRLVFPAVAALVLARCNYRMRDKVRLEIDAPRLRYFRYQGIVQRCEELSLKPQKEAANLAQVDLDLRYDSNDYNGGEDDQVREPFWRFIRNFSTAKFFKIQLHCPHLTMDRFAIADKGSQDELLGGLLFSLLERLELQAQYEPASKTSMVMLANLLHCCPVVRDLRLKLRKDICSRRRYSIDQEVRADFNKSVDRFRSRRNPMVSLGGGENDGNHDEAPYIPGLSGESFDCLRSYLRRVSLHFCMGEPTCLGVQLAKFFAENAMVLEEMCIDDGSHKMSEHMKLVLGDDRFLIIQPKQETWQAS